MIKIKGNLEKPVISDKINKMLVGLEDSIASLLSIEVGINISTKPSAYDIVLTADFNNEKGLDEYRVHPEHVKVLDYLKVVMEKAVVVDYIN